MTSHVHRRTFYLGCLMLALSHAASGAVADAPLASREADRQAKTAVPQAGEALIYVYRAADKNDAPLAATIAGRETVRLAPGSFALARVKPGRHALSAERGSSIALQCEGGRVYYVELARAPSGAPTLRPVSFATGRAQVQRSRLAGSAASPARPRAAAAPPADGPTRGALMFKFGSFSLAEDTQTIVGSSRRFDSSASSLLALEGEWFLTPDTSLGGEFLRYSNDFSTPGSGGTGQADTTVFLANIKRYFVLTDEWNPYIGAGAGAASTDFSGAITGGASGLALQVTGGLQWRRGQLALRGEYKCLRAKTEDDNNQRVDVSGSGLFLGVGFHF